MSAIGKLVRAGLPSASIGSMRSDLPPKNAAVARARLLGDRALQPLADQRAQLAILADRLERTGRAALTQHLASRVRMDSRYGPVLGKLLQLSLHS